MERVAVVWNCSRVNISKEIYQTILLRKNQTNISGEKINTDGEIINSEECKAFRLYPGLQAWL